MFMSSNVHQPVIKSLLLVIALILHGCGGDSSSGAGDSSTGDAKGLINDEEPYICTADYKPLCGKAKPEGISLECVQAPCENYEFRTFPNACHARHEYAQFSFNDECEGLENHLAFEDKPIRIKELTEVPIDNAPVTVTSVEIEGDIVTLEVSYSGGCGTHEFNLFVSNLFMESDPIQTESILSHVTEDACEALITEKLTFDLLPIREFYQRIYGQGPGSINIQGIGLYSFE